MAGLGCERNRAKRNVEREGEPKRQGSQVRIPTPYFPTPEPRSVLCSARLAVFFYLFGQLFPVAQAGECRERDRANHQEAQE
jgi:hypothetical protein